jgi:uncharacterized protein (DUF1684 family)
MKTRPVPTAAIRAIVGVAAFGAPLVFMTSVGLTPVVLAGDPAPTAAPAAAPAATPATDAAAAIAAEHKKIDDDLLSALMSPFTAIASEYFESGQGARLGAGEKGFAVDPPAGTKVMAEMSYQDGAFWIAPVAGSSSPSLYGRTKEGDVAPGAGKPVAEKTKLAGEDVVGIGRFYLETSPQSGYGRVLVYDPDAPMRKSFTGLKWFDPNPGLQVKARFVPDPAPEKVIVGTSRGLKKEYFRAGAFEFPLEGKTHRLTVLAGSAKPSKGEDLFIPFRDATSGKESYEVGRYLNMKFDEAGSTYLIDFNSATNPSCNYSPHYNCPIPPKENTLSVPIRAGEMAYPAHH